MLDFLLPVLEGFEQSGFSTGLRETQSFFGYYFILAFHTIGLAVAVGVNGAIDLRLLGFARDIPVPPLARLFRLIWIGLVLNAVSGVLLVMAYPVKSLTNLMFYVKLMLIGFAVVVLLRIKREVFGGPSAGAAPEGRSVTGLAMLSLGLWIAVLGAGRLLAYTCSYLLSGVPC